MTIPGQERSTFVDFDGMQVEIKTAIDAIQRMAESVFGHMIVNGSTRVASTISVRETDPGFILSSEEEIPFRRDQLDLLLDAVRDEVHRCFMKARPDLLWLHAAAIERDGAALLIAGRSGQGKSTLSTALCDRGWRMLSDDIAPTSMRADYVYPFPQTPRRRLFPGSMIDPYKLHTLEREEVRIEPESVSRLPVQVAAIVYIEFVHGVPAVLEKLSRGNGALELLRNSINFGDHKEAAVARAAELGLRVPAYRLCYDSVTEAVDKLQSLL